ncbi:MAG: protein kinase [Planctomycetota bacterium]
MTPVDLRKVREIVADLLELPPNERLSAAETRCAGDGELRSRVLELLAFDDRTLLRELSEEGIVSRREELARALGTLDRGSADTEPETIGAYRVVRRVGEGGMGIVYEAEQARPRRRVALKVLDSLRNAGELALRFRAEAEIQGRLQHPGIAQVFEAGVTAVGTRERAFIAMEFIDGRPLLSHASDAGLGVRDRVALLARAAEGVAYAHDRGVIHRDLKPENILVQADGQPKVLDFGIARVTSEHTLAATTMTRDGQILGTLAYMSPEQLAGDPSLIGTQADVYALGVMLFELLAGHAPLRLSGMSISAAMHAIERSEPPRLRSIDPSIDRDLDTIARRCLERDPSRRYEDAGRLADDLRRFLAHEPIVARPPTRRYLARKFVERNRLLVGGVSATVLSLVLGLVAASYFAWGQHRASQVAQRESETARRNEANAIAGVLGGARALIDLDQTWEAVRQMMSIDRTRRGWEWRHAMLDLPWVIDHDHLLQRAGASRGQVFHGFVSPTEFLLISSRAGRVWVVDVFTGEQREVPTDGIGVRTRLRDARSPGVVDVGLADGRIGRLDVRTGAFEEWHPPIPTELGGARDPTLFADTSRRTLVAKYGSLQVVWRDGVEVFREVAENPASSMTWQVPFFDREDRFVHLTDCAGAARVVTLDTGTWEQVGETRLRADHPRYARTSDGARVYASARTGGIDVLGPAPGFETIRTIDTGGVDVSRVALAEERGLLVYTSENPGVLHVREIGSGGEVWSASLGSERTGPFRPTVCPEGRLVCGGTRDDGWTWLTDLDRVTREPRGRIAQTTLPDRGSWIYQLAVSPDGSLLAAAEPEGDIQLWDLRADRLLTRIERNASRGDNRLAHNMDAPLVFTADGTTLAFGEMDPETSSPGVTVLGLDDGARSWTGTWSLDASYDLVADMLPDGVPAELYHHVVKLADGRVLRASSTGTALNDVVVRDRVTGDVKVLMSQRLSRTGNAAHPDGSVYASGEYQMIRIRDARTDAILFEIPDGSSSTVHNMAYSPDGSRLAMGTADGRVLIFETEFYTRLAQFGVDNPLSNSGRNYVFNLAWTPDGTRLITAGGALLRILESERPYRRELRARAWREDLDNARSGRDSSEPARRVVRIEGWASPDRDG